ncbi:tail fiber protein, partial [Escherichia coli]
MTVTPAASPALSGQKYAILVSDIISVDGLAQAMSQLIKEYDENIGAWETFATTSANQSITVTINGTTVTIPGIGKLAQKGSNGALAIADGGTGATNAADALTKLRLGAGAPAIGIPFFWPSSAMPNTVMPEWADMVFLKFNGATFSASTYPKLALVIPGLVLPDARGEFIRIWDDGRGVDSGRALLSAQRFAMEKITAAMYGLYTQATSQESTNSWYTGAATGLYHSTLGGGAYDSSKGRVDITFDSSKVTTTASETRPRNVAFNFL